MKALLFPFQFDLNGHIATVTQYPDVVRGQIIDVLMTNFNERVMRPAYGANVQALMFDATDELIRSDTQSEINKALATWCPRAVIRGLQLVEDVVQAGKLWIEVEYAAGPYVESSTLRLPTSIVMSEETDI